MMQKPRHDSMGLFSSYEVNNYYVSPLTSIADWSNDCVQICISGNKSESLTQIAVLLGSIRKFTYIATQSRMKHSNKKTSNLEGFVNPTIPRKSTKRGLFFFLSLYRRFDLFYSIKQKQIVIGRFFCLLTTSTHCSSIFRDNTIIMNR